jgi:hypothetical protein
MPDLAASFQTKIDNSLSLPEGLVQLRAKLKSGTPEAGLLHQDKIDTSYEAVYLRIFVAWEDFLEASFMRFLCGYKTTTYTPTFNPSTSAHTPARTLAAANLLILGGQQYKLWHNPKHVTARSIGFFTAGRHETILSSSTSRIEYFASIRHRIAHGQDDAKNKFDVATMALAGRRYPGSKPCLFLRDWVPGTTPRMRWIEAISDELHGLASQIIA